MIRVLAFTDPHGELDAAECVIKLARTELPDLVVCSGDIACLGRGFEPFLDRLRALERSVYFVPGNHEPADVCRGFEATYPYLKNVSYAREQVGGLQILGLPGTMDIAPPGPEELDGPRRAIELWRNLDRSRPLLLLSHYPPAGSACDGLHRRPDGKITDLPLGDEGGSKGVRLVCDAIKPEILVCGHYHQAFGREDRQGSVRIVNPGPRGRILEIAGGAA